MYSLEVTSNCNICTDKKSISRTAKWKINYRKKEIQSEEIENWKKNFMQPSQENLYHTATIVIRKESSSYIFVSRTGNDTKD